MLDGLGGTDAEESWRWFIDRYRAYVRTCLGRLIRPAARADRAVEEIWSYLFTSSMIQNADRDRRFRTYLAGTVRNFAFDWLRAHRVGDGDLAAEPVAPDDEPVRVHEEQELRLWTRQLVQLALTDLARSSPDQARALRWFYGLPDGLDTASGETRPASWIAARLGMKANAVHQLIFRARNRLRVCLEAELRDTVRDEGDLADERRLIYGVLGEESPGLGPE